MMKKCISAGIALLLIVCSAFVLFSCGGTDYVETVKAASPGDYAPTTYGTVLDKYIDAAKWEHRKTGDTDYVDVSGLLKEDKETKIAFTFKLSPYEGQSSNMFWIEPYSAEIDGEAIDSEHAAIIIISMFEAHKAGHGAFFDTYLALIDSLTGLED